MSKLGAARKVEQSDDVIHAVDADPAQLTNRLRRLSLDCEDLRFETARLKASLMEAEAETLAMAERNAALRDRLNRIERLRQLAPKWLVSIAKPILRRVLPG